MTCDTCGKEYGAYELSFSGRIDIKGATLIIKRGEGVLHGGDGNACRECAGKVMANAQIHGGVIRVEGVDDGR